MSKKPSPGPELSEKLKDFLSRIEADRRRRAGGTDDTADLQALAENVRLLRNRPEFKHYIEAGWIEVVRNFIQWLEIDPAMPAAAQEIVALHMETRAKFHELYRAETILKHAKEAKDGPRKT